MIRYLWPRSGNLGYIDSYNAARNLMFEIIPLHAFNDNYIWAMVDFAEHAAIVVDPGDEKPVIKLLEAYNLDLKAILVTHHHADHIGGLGGLSHIAKNIYGPANIAGVTDIVKSGDMIKFATFNINCEVIATPGHTLDHICYFFNGSKPFVFSGDTLFSVGCGRLFEGTPEQMLHSLARLKALPANTNLYCAHEYTLANIKFALEVEPDNPSILQRKQECEELLKNGSPTLPSTIAKELATNPFLRTTESNVIASLASQNNTSSDEYLDEIKILKDLRAWKDKF